jgi:hypothetical protein
VTLTNLPFAPPRSPLAAAAFRSESAPLTLLKSDTEPAVLATSSTQEPLQTEQSSLYISQHLSNVLLWLWILCTSHAAADARPNGTWSVRDHT